MSTGQRCLNIIMSCQVKTQSQRVRPTALFSSNIKENVTDRLLTFLTDINKAVTSKLSCLI